MSIFGWSYPPGAENDPNAPYNQDDPVCQMCARYVDDCECPECPVCRAVGDPKCYAEHGMAETDEQRSLRAADEEREKKDADDYYAAIEAERRINEAGGREE